MSEETKDRVKFEDLPKEEMHRLILLRNRVVDRYREIAEVNKYRIDTQKGRTAEFTYLQGAFAAEPYLAEDPVLAMCVLSGRSVLTLKPMKTKA